MRSAFLLVYLVVSPSIFRNAGGQQLFIVVRFSRHRKGRAQAYRRQP